MLRILFLCLLFPCLAHTQNQGNIWYFGDHAGLDFNTTPPTILTNGQTEYGFCPDACHIEGTASISDNDGNILIYTDGSKVFNRNHQIMPNGDSLFSNASATQSSLILPLPGSSDIFYIFINDGIGYALSTKGLSYSIVDLCLNNGLGDVIENQKNILLLGSTVEKLTGTKHSNGKDYWILSHARNSNAFYAYLLTSNGIVDTIISNIGSNHPASTSASNDAGMAGQLKVSPNGQLLAAANGHDDENIIEYYNFNNTTGEITNHVSLEWDNNNFFYGIEFSPDNSKLYVTGIERFNFDMYTDAGLHQFDLSAGGGNPDSIRASRIKISDTDTYWGMQLGPDGQIYVAYGLAYDTLKLGIITQPNSNGLSCNYIYNAIQFPSGGVGFSFPNFISSYNYTNSTPSCFPTSIGSLNEETFISLFPNPTNQTLNIKLTIDTGSIKLYDVTGSLLLEHTVTNNTSIDIGNLKSGMYFYEITVDGSTQQAKRGTLIKE